jgi:hypothetical protein
MLCQIHSRQSASKQLQRRCQDTRTVLGCQQERPHDLPGLEPDHSLQCRPQHRDKRYCQAQNDGAAQTTIISVNTKYANESS